VQRMAKIVVFNDADPNIGIVLEEMPQGAPGKARGWHGKCTQCGRVMHRWAMGNAIRDAQNHVDQHPSAL